MPSPMATSGQGLGVARRGIAWLPLRRRAAHFVPDRLRGSGSPACTRTWARAEAGLAPPGVGQAGARPRRQTGVDDRRRAAEATRQCRHRGVQPDDEVVPPEDRAVRPSSGAPPPVAMTAGGPSTAGATARRSTARKAASPSAANSSGMLRPARATISRSVSRNGRPRRTARSAPRCSSRCRSSRRGRRARGGGGGGGLFVWLRGGGEGARPP